MSTPSQRFSFVAIAGSLLLLGCAGNPAPAPATAAASPLAHAADALSGSWQCRGSIYGPDGSPSPSEVTVDVKLDLDAAWLQAAFAVSSGTHKYKFSSYRTFDKSSNKWVNVIVDNLGGHATSASTDGVVWVGDSHGPMGTMAIRDTETVVSSNEMKMLGQYSLDGATWRTGYELSCER